ncbi:MAG: hypothetical protein EOP62_12035 [Sphingomonadales bacterium]|nr:MAG: hypothetical protein EOP62_12035 [Sphingomonadales bacterium]
MAGAFTGYRRRVRIVPQIGRVDVDMEDDAHCFGVTLTHDGTTILAVETSAPRYPWTTCPAAGVFLASKMTGVLLADAADVQNQRDHCTHMYDLFVLAARHAPDHAPTVYDIRVSDPVDGGGAAGIRLAEIDLNGETILRWRLGDPTGVDGIAGGNLRELDAWTRTLTDDLQEAGRMLRRGALVSGTRFFDFPVGAAAGAMTQMIGACFTYQPGRADTALRVADTIRDFSNEPEKMLTGESDDRHIEGAASP